MKRREFLTLALGAALVVPALTQTNVSAVREQNKQKLMAIAIDYVNGSDAERERIIENVNYVIAEAEKAKRFRVKEFIEGYRDALLSYNVIPAAEVTR